jgi:hypothetical protein
MTDATAVEPGFEATASGYNDLRSRVLTLCQNIGVTLAFIEVYLGETFPAKVAGDTITNQDYDKLFLVLYWLRVHQNGTADIGIPTSADNSQWNEGDPIIAGDGYEYSDEGQPIGANATTKGFNDVLEAVLEAEGQGDSYATNQLSVTNASSGSSADTSTPTWGGGTNDTNTGGSIGDELAGDNSRGMIERVFDINFADSTARDRFFAMGGAATFYVRLTNSNGVPFSSNPGGAKANWWYNHLNVDNPISFKITKDLLAALTTSYIQVQEKQESDDALYSMNRTRVYLKKNAADTSVSVRVRCYDYDRALTSWPNNPNDEDVGERVATWVSLTRITGATNPLFNTVGANPSIVATDWTTNAITDQPALATAPPPVVKTFTGSAPAANTALQDLGTFTVPAAGNWTIKVVGAMTTGGSSNWTFFGLVRGSSNVAGDVDFQVRDGSYSGSTAFSTGLQLSPPSSGRRSYNINSFFFKTGSVEKTYYIRFRGNTSASGAYANCSVTLTAIYNGPST